MATRTSFAHILQPGKCMEEALQWLTFNSLWGGSVSVTDYSGNDLDLFEGHTDSRGYGSINTGLEDVTDRDCLTFFRTK